MTPGQGQGRAGPGAEPGAGLPRGWRAFSSRADGRDAPYWYAVSPYPVDALKAEWGGAAHPLCRTVSAATWAELSAEVRAQAEWYERLTGGPA